MTESLAPCTPDHGRVRVHEIQSFDAPELWPYRTMKRQLDHHAQGIFVAEGDKVTRRLLDSPIPVVSVLVPPECRIEFRDLLRSRPESSDLYVAEKSILEQLVGFQIYQGVLAVGKIPRLPKLEAILASFPSPRLFAAVDGLANAENLGAIIRNCAAFGVHALLAGETSACPFLRRSVRSSMGTLFKLPTLHSTDLGRDLRLMEAAGIRCIAAHPRPGSRQLSQLPLNSDCCLVFGSEGDGLRPGVLAACSTCSVVPMAEGVDSLNVASASAAFLYEAARQRGLV